MMPRKIITVKSIQYPEDNDIDVVLTTVEDNLAPPVNHDIENMSALVLDASSGDELIAVLERLPKVNGKLGQGHTFVRVTKVLRKLNLIEDGEFKNSFGKLNLREHTRLQEVLSTLFQDSNQEMEIMAIKEAILESFAFDGDAAQSRKRRSIVLAAAINKPNKAPLIDLDNRDAEPIAVDLEVGTQEEQPRSHQELINHQIALAKAQIKLAEVSTLATFMKLPLFSELDVESQKDLKTRLLALLNVGN